MGTRKFACKSVHRKTVKNQFFKMLVKIIALLIIIILWNQIGVSNLMKFMFNCFTKDRHKKSLTFPYRQNFGTSEINKTEILF